VRKVYQFEEIAQEKAEKEAREETLRRMIDAQMIREAEAEEALKAENNYSIEDKANPINTVLGK
jgi:cell division protein FtsW